MFNVMGKKGKDNKGFTLIELIVVIAIIAILALILVPRFGGFRDSAQEAADAATSKTIQTAVTAIIVKDGITVEDETSDTTFTVGEDTTVDDIDNITTAEATIIEGRLQKILGTKLKGEFLVTIDKDQEVTVEAAE